MGSFGGSGELFVVGVSWRTAAVAVRERLAFRDDEMASCLADLLASPDIDEAIILSTCNRVEIYGSTAVGHVGARGVAAAAEARSFLARSRGVAAEGLAAHLYERVDVEAIRHLFRVAAALDSMVVGESQILGQLKDAYGVAVRAQATGAILGRSMEKAFQVAKRVRSETGISRGAANVSSVAVELARRVFGDLQGKTVLVIGAGKMSALAARHLRVAGAHSILVTNRSPERAVELAAEVEGSARPWEDLPHLLAEADVVLSSTGAREPILTPRLVRAAMKARRWRPQVVVDIAVPRDADPAIGRLDGVYLFDIDDLERVVAENLKERQKEAEAALSIVELEVLELQRWLRAQRVVPTIRSLREHFHQVAMSEAERCIGGLGGQATGPEVQKAIRRMSELIANKLLHTPLSALKASDHVDLETMVEVTHRLFALSGRAAEPATRETAAPVALAASPASAGSSSAGSSSAGSGSAGSSSAGSGSAGSSSAGSSSSASSAAASSSAASSAAASSAVTAVPERKTQGGKSG